MIVEILETALDALGENMSEPIAGILILAVVALAVLAVAFLVFLRRH